MNQRQSTGHTRHRYLNLLQFRFPVSAVLSVGHRAAGLLLFLLTPALILLLERSLAGPESFAALVAWLQGGLVRAGLLLVLWAGYHHLFAGLRFLLMDLGIGEQRRTARASAWSIMAGSLPVALVTLWALS